MTTLVVGASGATGRLLVEQLLLQGESVRIIVRKGSSLPETFIQYENLSIIYGSILEFSDADLLKHTQGCQAVVSCLGHNISLRGMFGQPRRLVTDAVRRLCDTVKNNTPEKPVKFVLMNTTGNSNRDIPEKTELSQKLVTFLLRLLLPPHVDNEKAADFLRIHVGQDHKYIEWVAVRPDGLINEENVSPYEIYPSPIRNAIFDAGTTSRINVAEFMSELVLKSDLWDKWKGQMPVIYNTQNKNRGTK